MAGKKNAFYSNSFQIFIIRFFPTLANLVVMIYYSRLLPKELYGAYNNFWIHLNIFYPFISIGLQALIITYPAGFLVRFIRNIKTRQYSFYALWAIVLSLGFAVFEQYEIGIPAIVSFFFILSLALTFIFESMLMTFKEFKLLIAVNIAYSLAYWLAHYMVVNGVFSVNKIFIIVLIITLSRAIIYFVILGYKVKNSPLQSADNIVPEIKEIRNLWLHLGIYDIVQTLSMWVDKFIVSLFLSASVSAVYYNGSMNIPFLPLLITAAGSAFLIQLANDGNAEGNAIMLLNQTGKILSCIVFPVFFFLLFFSHELFVGLLFGAKYEAALPIFIASLFILPVRAYNFTSVLQRFHRGAIINKGAIGEIVIALIIAYPMYKWYGLPGLALCFVISTYMQAAYYIASIAKILNVKAWQLIPIRNWATKFVAIGFILFYTHKFLFSVLGARPGLYLGGGIMAVVIGAALFVEIKYPRPTVIFRKR